ncbi:MAG: aminopeptidase P family N-terminal domain-containing protein [Paludibacteraceae bacterium]|nr:aminopeptidase P family N-terminal domain-containing protein [Paludibacteraceae bacterium]
MTIIERLLALRSLMKEHGIDAYIIPGTDPHASEYMAPHWAEMSWITGFKGESGTAVVTMDKALLWTDSRYYLQAGEELKGSSYELMRESDVDCPSISKWLGNYYAQDGTNHSVVVGVNPEMYSINAYKALREELADGGLRIQSIDLIRPIWKENRPDIPMNPLYIYKEQYAGESVASKLKRVREALQENRCDAAVIAELDEIGWLLNVRGTDVDYTPCVIAYCVVEMSKCTLFIDSRKVSDSVREQLCALSINLQPYEDVFAYLRSISAKNVLMDGNRVNEALYECTMHQSQCKVVSPSPIQLMMSIKNAVELAGERKAMREDAVALTRFFKWLDEEALQTPQTEITLAEKLHAYRMMGTNFTDESFGTIAGWNANGAIVHYAAQPDTCAKISGNGVLLLDSGGQYLDGTTDITRTYWIGDEKAIDANLKRDYTLVLKGHIALAKARFPKGTRGNQLDVLAHQFMWAEGINYGHGTGHGVGHFMGCHEGPANIRTDNNTNPIREGNVFSDEPGIYRAGEYGIRIENLVTAKKAEVGKHSTGEQYYDFETLTLCFYDTRLIDLSMMTRDEIAWINQYHAWVEKEISPLLSNDEKKYLQNKCKAI